MQINYNNRKFRVLENTQNGETSEETIFTYQQEGNLVFAEYSGGAIQKGHLLARVLADNSLEMAYHQINTANELLTGKCRSMPELLPDGRLRLHESWQWTNGDGSAGHSIIEEIN